MKLNDPFGRMERRHQVSYEALRESLNRNNINTVEGAQKIIRETKIRALKIVAGAGLVLLLTYLLRPDFLVGIGAVAVLIGAWAISWTVNGERYVRRYIEEELSGGRPDSEPTASE